MKFKIRRRKYNVKGNLAWEYNPLRNLEKVNSEGLVTLSDFDTDGLTLDINHPVDIECKTSYDGSTDIIFNDDMNPPRIVNSSFTVKEDNSFVRISRNQRTPTNVYKESKLDSSTRLQKITDYIKEGEESTSDFLYFDYKEICGGGALKGGNYVFVAQYSDDDDNLSKIVAESGIVSVWGGNLEKPETTYGTLMHEDAGKMVRFELNNVDECFSRVYISYRRDYCDLNGVKQTEYKKITKPYKINGTSLNITIDGRELIENTTYEKLTESINVYTKVKTSAQTQNMLFFGNVEETYDEIKTLQTLALQILVRPVWGNYIGYLNQEYFEQTKEGSEYFNTHNIYDNLGYMPEEFYRIGIVFIYNDDSRSSVYNLRGTVFEEMYQWNFSTENSIYTGNKNNNIQTEGIDINELFVKENSLENTKGVFRMPKVNLYSSKNIATIKLQFSMPSTVALELKKLNIKGYYYVRQNRIPIFLAQGFSIGVSNSAYIPMLSSYTLNDGENNKQVSFGTDSVFVRTDDPEQLKKNGKKKKKNKNGGHINLFPTRTCVQAGEHVRIGGLLCPDAVFNAQIQSMMCGSKYKLRKTADYQSCNLFPESPEIEDSDNGYYTSKKINLQRTEAEITEEVLEKELIYIPQNSSFRAYKDSIFSTKAGASADVKSLRSVMPEVDKHSFKLNSGCVRGNYTAFVGVVGNSDNKDELEPNTVYNIYSAEYDNTTQGLKNAITLRAYNRSEFTSICDPYSIKTSKQSYEIDCARGDCFTCTSAHKFSYNFLDNNAPLNEIMVKGHIRKDTNVKKNEDPPKVNQFFDKNIDEIDASAWIEWNVSDVNAADFGHYVTLKYMSNYNNIRAVDSQKIDEISLFGSPRQFFPLSSATSGVAFKIPESVIVNYGLSSSRTLLPHFEAVQIPYVNNNFDTRIAFSNVNSTSNFSDGYRVFSGISYQDIERTYGAITKLLPLGQNLFCVFEHGCGIIPINEKALLSTTTGQSIHMYGAGVLQEQVTVISQDYGSTWEDSIIVTTDAIYGVDTWAKKLWKYNQNGFEIISDQIVQRFLNENLLFKESDIHPTTALKNIKAHYNKYKGDVMFTFYKNDVCWNLCYNERIKKFTTRYSWIPLFSENIQNSYISIDRNNIKPYAFIAENKTLTKGVSFVENYSEYPFNYERIPVQYNSINISDDEVKELRENTCKFARTFELKGYSPCNSLMAHIKSVTYPVWDDVNKKEVLNTVVNDTKHGFWIDPHDVIVKVPIDDGDILGENESAVIDSDGNTILEKTTTSKVKASVVGWGTEKIPVYLESLQDKNYILSDNEYFHEDTSDINDDNDLDFNKLTNFKAKWSNYVTCTSGSHLGVEIKLDEFVSWIKVQVEITPMVTTLNNSDGEWGEKSTSINSSGDPFVQDLYFIANYDFIKSKIEDSVVSEEYLRYKNIHDNTLRVGLYTHGRAGIYDEIDYTDLNQNNQIKPTFWYNKQEPFEFEFVVNTPMGVQKIFENLVIISNNAEPESLEISLIGDAYDFNKAGIFASDNTVVDHDSKTGILDIDKLEKDKLAQEFANTNRSQSFDIRYNHDTDREIKFQTFVSRDNVLNQYVLTVHDDCRNVKDVRWGKRLGNIEYREDKWLVTLSPIMFKNTELVTDSNGKISGKTYGSTTSVKIRDKWCKVRIKYKGDKLIVISAIQTLLSLSYS